MNISALLTGVMARLKGGKRLFNLKDLDGVLHHFKQLKAIVKLLWQGHALPRLFREHIGREFDGETDWANFKPCLDKPGAWPQIFRRISVAFTETYGVDVSADQVREVVRDEVVQIIENGDWEEHPGMRELCDLFLQWGIASAVVTSSLDAYARRLLRKIGFEHFFQCIFCADDAMALIEKHRREHGEELDLYKPHVASWLAALSAIAAEVEQASRFVIVWEDNEQNGAQAVLDLFNAGEDAYGIIFCRGGKNAEQTRSVLHETWGFGDDFLDERICIIDPDQDLGELCQAFDMALREAKAA